MALTKLDKNLLGFSDDTDFVKLPSGTTAQRPGSPAAGQFRFNTTINDAEVYDGTAWQRMGIAPPTFSSVDYPGSATALNPDGGETLVINGTQFNTGITITIGGTTPSSITRNSSTQLSVTAPAKSAGTYDIVFTNTDGGTATASNAVSYNGVPAFTNAAGSLGSVKDGDAINFSVAATEPDGGAITYAVTSGSLPSGATLNTTTGAITGTAPSVSADTTSNFTITATDNENQTASRAYSITITPQLPSDSFQVVTYTGNSGTQAITGVGFQPDFVWIKCRSTAHSHFAADSTRGATKYIMPNETSAELTRSDQIQSFDTDGFTLAGNGDVNGSSKTYVAWCWKSGGGTTSSNTDGTITSTVQANTDSGFSIVKYTGVSGGGSWGHGLAQEPEFIIFKRYTSSQNWFVFAKISGAWHYIEGLNTSAAAVNYASNMSGSSTTMTLNNIAEFNTDPSSNYLAYCFHSVNSFSKFGSYTGNGSTNGPIVETGFEPAFLMIKKSSGTDNWYIIDNKRSTSNPREAALFANLSDAEYATYGAKANFYSNGFQITTTDGSTNANSATYIYMAFAADPDTTSPTLADSFGTKLYTGNGGTQSITGFGFKPDFIWIKKRNGTGNHYLQDTLRGLKSQVSSNVTAAETTYSSNITSYDTDGFTLGTATDTNNNGSTYVSWVWKAAGEVPSLNTDGSITSIVNVNQNSGFSIIKYNMNLTSGTFTIGHGLSSAPELVFFFSLDQSGSTSNIVYPNDNSKILVLDSNGAASSGSSYWNSASPTSTVINMGTGWTSNHTYYAGDTIAYAFHSVNGFSKIGSYTGNGSAQSITGLGFQPNWIMIKQTNASNSWRIFDSVRGLSSPQTLFADLNAAEDSESNTVSSFDSDGFTMGSQQGVNDNGDTYIYMAFKIN